MEKAKEVIKVVLILVVGISLVFQLFKNVLVLPVVLYKLIKLLLPLGIFMVIIYLISLILKKK